MNISRSLITIPLKYNNCLFHTSSFFNGEGKVMRKIMGDTKKKKFKYHEAPLLPTPSTFTVGAYEGKRSSNSRRVNVLNKLFMRYITDLMSTGECSSAFVGHGIEINHVQITADFSCVRIYWSANSENEAIEDILNKNVGLLRHELAQLKVVGVIPRLQFVKDKQSARLALVDKLLAKADYGDDYVPVDLTAKVKTELQLNTTLDPYIKLKIEKLEDTVANGEYDDLPPMPNNVFGLNHAKIREQIENATKKSKALHRIQPLEEMEPSTLLNVNPINFASEAEEKEAFRLFLQKQQITKSKMEKLMKKHIADLERVEEEWIQPDVGNDVTEESDFVDDDYDSFTK
ncbi:hypothetical protein RI129_003851 [Pyrocoelia pectoralis]|uniref:Ribosome-binding factor A n=1 Tax=Pyrocoelia pectoralis TaxID=417401 RepID=A0AAN7VS60_9COLE